MGFVKNAQDGFDDAFMLDFEQLWVDEGYGKDNDFGVSLRFIEKELSDLPKDLLELVLLKVFTDIANGKKFSTTGCTCGCGIENSGTDVIHYIISEVRKLYEKDRISHAKLLQERFNKILNSRLKGKKLGAKRRLWFELVRGR